MTKIKEAFENIWKLRLMQGYNKEDKEQYYELFLDGYGCSFIDLEDTNKEDTN